MASPQSQDSRTELLFLAALIVLCALLAAVQYRWTGALARSEADRVIEGTKSRAGLLCAEIDAALARGSKALTPLPEEIEHLGHEKAHEQCWQRWRELEEPLFSHVNVVVVRQNKLVHFTHDLKTGKLVQGPWRKGIELLRENLQAKLNRWPSPPFFDPWGLVFEHPVFGDQGELEWIIFEIDTDYVGKQWLPAIIQERLASSEGLAVELRVSATETPDRVLYASSADLGEIFFTRGINDFHGLADRPRPGPPRSSWTVEVGKRKTALDDLVASARWRSMSLAGVLTLLILAAGVLLLKQTQRKREIAAEQMRFVATVSHELRTPLTVIRTAAHSLQRGVVQEPERVTQYLGLISQNTEQLTEMVEQVLAYAGAQSTKALRREPVAMAALLSAAAQNAVQELDAAGCVLERAWPETLPTLSGDESALRRAVQNLLSNAAKHAGSGGWVGLSAEVKDALLHISVRDRGPGIPEEEVQSVFQPFVRGQRAQEQQVRGSGLGLSLVKEITEAHGGSISLTNEAPTGCCFTLTLPLA